MIVQVSYERVFNLGNFENHRISATATVENGDHVAAFAEAQTAVELQHDLFIAEREAEQARQEAKWQRLKQEQRATIRQRNNEDNEDLPL